MGRRGRPPSSRGVYSFEEQLALPHELVLDTSFVVEALLPHEPLHDVCAEALARMVDEETVVFFNRLLELELIEATYELALVERFGSKGWRRRRLDGRARRRANTLSRAMLDASGQLLEPWITRWSNSTRSSTGFPISWLPTA